MIILSLKIGTVKPGLKASGNTKISTICGFQYYRFITKCKKFSYSIFNIQNFSLKMQKVAFTIAIEL